MYYRKWFAGGYRHPKTTQELRANQDRNNPYVRGARRNLPTYYDDIRVSKTQKSWKARRLKQYREDKKGYEWREYHYSLLWGDREGWMIARNIMHRLDLLGCYWKHNDDGIRWFGPEMVW